jgi:hypothetical protein
LTAPMRATSASLSRPSMALSSLRVGASTSLSFGAPVSMSFSNAV